MQIENRGENGGFQMKWSRYNYLFQSKRNGWLLYNSASNLFLALQEEEAQQIQQQIQQQIHHQIQQQISPSLFLRLRIGGFLVGDTQDDDFLRIMKMKRLEENYGSEVLALTIAPTRACNFDCPYCFETNRTRSMMTEETEDALVQFIKDYRGVRRLELTWYGGEPLLAFDRILSLNRKIRALEMPYKAALVTNGSLLNDRVTAALDELRIEKIQITLDGSRETHNRRRIWKKGTKKEDSTQDRAIRQTGGEERIQRMSGEKEREGTYDLILANIDRLLYSGWKGRLHIRVNVDPQNQKEFIEVYRTIQARYPQQFGRQVRVYAGFVRSEEVNEQTNAYFKAQDKSRFLVDLHETYGVNPLRSAPGALRKDCMMTRRNDFVVGPDGELYKCWDDVGAKDRVVGSIASDKNWNMALLAEQMMEGSCLEDEECQNCFFFPVCDGGCPKRRMLNRRDGWKARDICPYSMDYIEGLLEMLYEQRQRRG